MAKCIHVVGGAIEREGRFLAARRGEGMSLPGKWEFPGGKIEEGEEPQECLARELREELAIEVRVGSYVATGIVGGDDDDDRRIQLDVYRCEWSDGELALREHSEVAWVSPSEMSEYDWADADWPAVIALGGHPKGYGSGD